MQEKNKLFVHDFKRLKEFKEVCHGIFSRRNGCSLNSYSSLNMGDNVLDEEESVRENIKRGASFFGLKKIAVLHQVHGKEVVHVKGDSFIGLDFSLDHSMEKPLETNRLEKADAMITDQKGMGLLIRHADCQAGLFYDPKKKIIAAAHSGWRGNCLNIYKEVVREMGSNPKDVICVISPSLGPNYAEFIHYKKELPESFWRYQVKENYFDFWKIAEDQLLSIGLIPKNIEIARICTYTHSEDYYSYRREKVTGRNGAMIGLC